MKKKTVEHKVTDEISAEQLKISDLLNFTSAVFVVIGSAILYFSGWLYLATWYSFYSIDLTQIQIPTQLVLVNGIPGVFIALLVGFISSVVTLFYNGLRNKPVLKKSDTPLISLISCILGISAISLISKYSKFNYTAHINVDFMDKSYSFDLFGAPPIAFYSLMVLLAFFIFGFLLTQTLKYGIKLFPQKNKSLLQIIKSVEFIRELWQFWGGMLALIYAIIILAISSALGDIDARRGGHIMSGNRELASAEIYSKNPIPGLKQEEKKGEEAGLHVYGPLSLVHSDANTYYLAEQNPLNYYYGSPNVYFIPRSSDINVVFAVHSGFSTMTKIEIIKVSPTSIPLTIGTQLPIPSATPTP